MPSRDDDKPLQSLAAASDGDRHADESTARLRQSLEAIESKLQRPDGWQGLANWLDEVEEALTAIDDSSLEKTRGDIRRLIDELLELNAHVQNVLRLKQLLS